MSGSGGSRGVRPPWASVPEISTPQGCFAPPSIPLRDFVLAPPAPLVLVVYQHRRCRRGVGGVPGGRGLGVQNGVMVERFDLGTSWGPRTRSLTRFGSWRPPLPPRAPTLPHIDGVWCCMGTFAGPGCLFGAPGTWVDPCGRPWALGAAQKGWVGSGVLLSRLQWLVFSVRP